jgi:beta-N-acetylhexosaminidase
MRKRNSALIVIILLVLGLGVVFFYKYSDQIFLPKQPSSGSKKEIPVVDPIKDQIQDMSLKEKVGQLVMVGLDGYEMNINSQKLIQDYHVGGFVLLKRNVKDSQQLLDLVNTLKETNSINKIPLFLAIDEEGGRVSRMPEEFKKMPTSQKIGEHNNRKLSKRVGEILGKEVKAFGMNMNLAPVLDIFCNPQNTVIGDRAFGDNPDLVSKLGLQAMKGIQEQGIISVVKHFPGHGDTSVDSHVGLPIIGHDLERLMVFELLPFSHVIDNNVDAIMLAHILLPKLDPNFPASFSETIISEILREKMNYDGVIMTDDMTMGAIADNYDISNMAVKSIQSGCDIILICNDFSTKEDVLKAIHSAVETGIISSERIDESVYRVLQLKKKYSLTDQQVESVDVQGINSEIEQLYKDYPDL